MKNQAVFTVLVYSTKIMEDRNLSIPNRQRTFNERLTDVTFQGEGEDIFVFLIYSSLLNLF